MIHISKWLAPMLHVATLYGGGGGGKGGGGSAPPPPPQVMPTPAPPPVPVKPFVPGSAAVGDPASASAKANRKGTSQLKIDLGGSSSGGSGLNIPTGS